MHTLRILVALSLLEAVTPRAIARATTLVAVRSETVARAADRVVRGTVLATEARWRDGRIVTRVRVGGGSADTWFEHPGGTVDGVTMQVVGMPHFQPGEQVVVFLAERHGRLRLVGLSEGKLEVVRQGAADVVFLRLEDDGPRVAVPLADAVTRLQRVTSAARAGRR